MGKKVEVFFDYVCPFCDKGIRQFLDILPEYPDVEVIWRPCEAHPRPEHASIHSDLAIQAMYCLRDHGGDLIQFHTRVYDAWFRQRRRIDDMELLATLAGECGGEKGEVLEALRKNLYADEVIDGNRYAWEEKGLYAVPSYCSGDQTAYSKNGLLVSIKKVRALMEPLMKENSEKFRDRYMKGEAAFEEIFDLTDEWNFSDTTVTLREYLGLTADEEDVWISESDEALQEMMEQERKGKRKK